MVRYFPVAATALIELGNLGHVVRMFQQRSSEGQSVLAYGAVIVALALWERFFAIRAPKERLAKWSARVGILVNAAVAGCVIYFR